MVFIAMFEPINCFPVGVFSHCHGRDQSRSASDLDEGHYSKSESEYVLDSKSESG